MAPSRDFDFQGEVEQGPSSSSVPAVVPSVSEQSAPPVPSDVRDFSRESPVDVVRRRILDKIYGRSAS